MMPIYGRMMDSNPHQKNQFEYQQNFPSHNFPLNLSNPPTLYQSLPHCGNYAYPYPLPLSSCCNHGNFPGFHNHVPYCPPPQPPHHYYPGQTYPACYLPPPPYYSPGPFGYHDPTMNNNMAWNQGRHFFGSPYRDSEDRDDPTLIPVRIKGCPYPVSWIPQEYVKPLDETRARDQKVVKENGENLTPVVWVPRGGREEEGIRIKEDVKESGDQEKQFRFPIVWMPAQDVRVKDVAEGEKAKESSPPPQRIEDVPFILKFLPVEEKLGSGGDGAGAKAEVRDETRKDNAKSEDRTETQKDNAKSEDRAETRKEEAKREDRAKTRKDVQVKQELPPVCLRVDPLPKKKKNENGGSRSRSPSPPKQKTSTDKPLSNNEKPKEPVVVVEKVIDRPLNDKEEPNEPVVVREKVIDRPQSKNEEPKEPVVVVDKIIDGPQVERKEVGKKPLSDLEAAQCIQSAYRGYETRRSQPLQKLKQISEVRKQVADIRDRIQALESSSDVQKDDKNRLVVGETIMRLLLQLDTIQGLLPSLRDVRKTLAKELVSLQEKLDSLGNKAEKPELETCSSLPVDVGSMEAESKPEEAVETPVIEPEKIKLESCSSGSADALAVENEEVKRKQEKSEETLVTEAGSLIAETCASGAVDVLGVEVEEFKCKRDKPEETFVIEPEMPKSKTFSTGLVDVPSVEAEDVECKQETPEETPVIEQLESETCIPGPVNVVDVEAEETECKLEKQGSGPVDVLESGKPELETCHSGPVNVLNVKAAEVESGQEKLEKTHAITSENPEFEICHSGPVDVESIQEKPEEICVIQSGYPESETCNSAPVDILCVEAQAIESGREKQGEETKSDRSCDDVVLSDFERELADTTQADNILEPEKAGEAQLKEDTKETHVMENPVVELDHKSANGENLSDKDSIEVKKPDQALEAMDNEKLREMMEKLLEAGEKQLNVISGLSARVKDLEKKLYSRNKLRTKKNHSRRSVVKNAE